MFSFPTNHGVVSVLYPPDQYDPPNPQNERAEVHMSQSFAVTNGRFEIRVEWFGRVSVRHSE